MRYACCAVLMSLKGHARVRMAAVLRWGHRKYVSDPVCRDEPLNSEWEDLLHDCYTGRMIYRIIFLDLILKPLCVIFCFFFRKKKTFYSHFAVLQRPSVYSRWQDSSSDSC